jgi:hypothetical protein
MSFLQSHSPALSGIGRIKKPRFDLKLKDLVAFLESIFSSSIKR